MPALARLRDGSQTDVSTENIGSFPALGPMERT
jgi:hypothetical protein